MSAPSQGSLIPQPIRCITQQQLDSHLWGVATLLHGYICIEQYY